MDIHDSRPGTNYVIATRERVLRTDVLLVLIGHRWSSPSNLRRLHDVDDLLRDEILIGLESGARVLPVLINDAKIPDSDDLPDELGPLATLQALEISDSRWDFDVRRLAAVLGVEPREDDAASPVNPQSVFADAKRYLSAAWLRWRSARN